MYQHSTSGAAYKEAKININEKQRKVLEAIAFLNSIGTNPNDKEITEYLGWAINCVTPRRGELLTKGLIYETGKLPDPKTGRTTSYWKVSNKQLNLF